MFDLYVGEEDDKENKTPPPRDISAASVKDEPDWLPKTKESEERDFLLAVENSLRDQVTMKCSCVLIVLLCKLLGFPLSNVCQVK